MTQKGMTYFGKVPWTFGTFQNFHDPQVWRLDSLKAVGQQLGSPDIAGRRPSGEVSENSETWNSKLAIDPFHDTAETDIDPPEIECDIPG